MVNKSLEGILFINYEGVKDSVWGFQDKDFINLKPAKNLYKNLTVWDRNNTKRKGKIKNIEAFVENQWITFPDPLIEDPDYFISSLKCGEKEGDFEADKRLMQKYRFKIKPFNDAMDEKYGKKNWYLKDKDTAITPDGAMVANFPFTEPQRPYSIEEDTLVKAIVNWEDGITEQNLFAKDFLVLQWDYNGMHFLKNGDCLTIYYPKTKNEVWSGLIDFKEPDLSKGIFQNLLLPSDSMNIKQIFWKKYFFKEYPAKLIPYNK